MEFSSFEKLDFISDELNKVLFEKLKDMPNNRGLRFLYDIAVLSNCAVKGDLPEDVEVIINGNKMKCESVSIKDLLRGYCELLSNLSSFKKDKIRDVNYLFPSGFYFQSAWAAKMYIMEIIDQNLTMRNEIDGLETYISENVYF